MGFALNPSIRIIGNVMSDRSGKDYYSGTIYRDLSLIFGLFLTGLGVYVVFFGVVEPLIRVGLGLLIAVFGINTVWSAAQSKASWLTKLGPLF